MDIIMIITSSYDCFPTASHNHRTIIHRIHAHTFFQRKNRPTSTTLTLLSFPNAVTLFPGQKEKMAKHSKATVPNYL
jgi:hypothetical protein